MERDSGWDSLSKEHGLVHAPLLHYVLILVWGDEQTHPDVHFMFSYFGY